MSLLETTLIADKINKNSAPVLPEGGLEVAGVGFAQINSDTIVAGANTTTHLEVNNVANFKVGDLITFPNYNDLNGWVKALTVSGVDLAYPLTFLPPDNATIYINRKHYFKTDSEGRLQVG
jgi:hypothetical protein